MNEKKKRVYSPLDDVIKDFRRRYKASEAAQRIAELYRLGLLTLDEAIKSIFAL